MGSRDTPTVAGGSDVLKETLRPESDEFRMGGVRSLDEGGDGTSVSLIDTLTEVELSAVGEIAL